MWKNSMGATNKRPVCKPRLKWKCPRKIGLSEGWLVAAGEESEEVRTQKLRERKVPEVVYRRHSHIPSSPFAPRKVQEDDLDESRIPVVPLIPIEECEQPEGSGGTEVLVQNSQAAASPCDTPSEIKPAAVGEPAPESGSSTQADVALAAATVITALLKTKESGSSIDTDLLVKIFRDPVTVKKLINEAGAPSCSETETATRMNLPETTTPLASSKPLLVEKDSTFNGSLKSSVDTSSPNPGTVARNETDEKRAAVDEGKAFLYNSGQVKHELNLFQKGVAPVPRPNSMLDHFTYLSQPGPVVLKSTSFPVTPIGTPLPSMSRPKPDLDEFKWTDNGYGVPAKTIIEPVSMPNSFSPGVAIQTPNEGLLLPTINPLPNERQTDSKLKAVLSDAVSSTDSPLMSPPIETIVNSYLFPHQPQHNLEMNRPFSNPIQPLPFSTDSPLMSSPIDTIVNSYLISHQPQHNLEMNRPLSNPIQSLPFSTDSPLMSSPIDTIVNSYLISHQPQHNLEMNRRFPNPIQPLSFSTDSSLMSSPVDTIVNSYLFSHQPQHNLEMNRPFPNPIKLPSFSTDSPRMSSPVETIVNSYLFQNQTQHTLEMNRPFPNPLQPPPFLPKADLPLHEKNYFKALVQQHGKAQPNQDNNFHFQQQNTKPVPHFDPNVRAMKIQRSCFFFNSPEGCKLGDSCAYLHDQPANVPLGGVIGTHSSKRMKLDGDIFGVHR